MKNRKLTRKQRERRRRQRRQQQHKRPRLSIEVDFEELESKVLASMGAAPPDFVDGQGAPVDFKTTRREDPKYVSAQQVLYQSNLLGLCEAVAKGGSQISISVGPGSVAFAPPSPEPHHYTYAEQDAKGSYKLIERLEHLDPIDTEGVTIREDE